MFLFLLVLKAILSKVEKLEEMATKMQSCLTNLEDNIS
jgi:hypothetical protein